MWRYLTGLNNSDLMEEMRQLNASNSDFVFEVGRHSFIKGEDLSERLTNIIEQHSRGRDFFIKSPKIKNGNYDLLFSISPVSLHLFLRKLADENLGNDFSELKELEQNISTNSWSYSTGDKELQIDKPLIMGILNITPDSFSDGGKFFDADRAYRHAISMLEAGADIIDIGGESTRPGSTPVSIEEEWNRISGVIGELLKNDNCIVSVDTYKSEIARCALEMGAHIINDISGLTFDPGMARVVADFKVPVILMHIKGTPRNMQKNPQYKNVMAEIHGFLGRQCHFAQENGVGKIMVDPGIGFGKRPQDNYELIRRIGEFRALGYPVVLGASRKSFIGLGLGDREQDRTLGSISCAITGILNGANIVRVHDVEETQQAFRIVGAIQDFKANSQENNTLS